MTTQSQTTQVFELNQEPWMVGFEEAYISASKCDSKYNTNEFTERVVRIAKDFYEVELIAKG